MASLEVIARPVGAGAFAGGPWTVTASGLRARLAGGAVLATLIAAALLRLVWLEDWPVFADEDSYVMTAYRASGLPFGAAMLEASASTMKGPLPTLLHIAAGALTGDVLVGARALAALCGVATTGLCFLLGRRLGGTWVGVVAAALYALAPVALLHERMVNVDSMLAGAALAAVLVAWTAVERGSLRLGLAAAALGALAVQLKTPGVAVAIAPLMLLLMMPARSPASRRAAVAATLGPVLSHVLLMASPIGGILQAQNAMLARPFAALALNLRDAADAALTYGGLGLVLSVALGAFVILRERRGSAVAILAMGCIWAAPWPLLSEFAPTRYYLPSLPYILAVAAHGLIWMFRSASVRGRAATGLGIAGAVLVVWPSAIGGVRVVVDHANAPLSRLDDWQFRSGWPSGYGYREATEYVRAHAEIGASVAFAVDMYHQAGAGLPRAPRADLKLLGFVEPDGALPAGGPLYVVTDDGRDLNIVGGYAELGRVDLVREHHPELDAVARFPRPGSDLGVTVLRSR